MTALKTDGFTAVVLTHNRLATLFDVIRIICRVPSLRKVHSMVCMYVIGIVLVSGWDSMYMILFFIHQVIVVWNNMVESPPSLDAWPKISQPLHIIQPKANKLSNRCDMHCCTLLSLHMSSHAHAGVHRLSVYNVVDAHSCVELILRAEG